MRRIIFTSLGVITLIAIIASAWVGAGERLSLSLDHFKTVRLASLPMRPLSAYNRGEGTYHAGAFFIGKKEVRFAECQAIFRNKCVTNIGFVKFGAKTQSGLEH